MALTNDNRVGYIQNWVYEQEVTWTEKACASPHWTGLTLLTIGAKGEERNKTKRHFMHNELFAAEVFFHQQTNTFTCRYCLSDEAHMLF